MMNPHAPSTERSAQPLVALRILWVVWPAFVAAGAAEAVFFTLFDPFDLHLLGAAHETSREAFYSVGFFGFWALGIASSALTLLLHRPLVPADRPGLTVSSAHGEEGVMQGGAEVPGNQAGARQ